MKPGKQQKSKQRCQNLCWKVHDRAQSFVLSSYTIHELLNFWLVPQSVVNNYYVLCTVKVKNTNENIQQVEFHNHFFLLTMHRLSFSCKDVSDILSQNLINIYCLESMKHIQTKFPLVYYYKKPDLHAPICFASNV